MSLPCHQGIVQAANAAPVSRCVHNYSRPVGGGSATDRAANKQQTKEIDMKKKSVAKVFGWKIGQLYLVCTVTRYLLGRLEHVGDHEIVLSDCAWVADTGRFSEALRTGKLSEVEPYPDGPVIVGRGAIVDASEWHGEAQRIVL
jgi:hypothetical protein